MLTTILLKYLFIGVINANDILSAIQTLGFDTRYPKLYNLIDRYSATENEITFKAFLDIITKGIVSI
jgi:Ca2+-binding EF-hand superfamily protein